MTITESTSPTALLLIAHGSRIIQANSDLDHVAGQILERGNFPIVQTSYLELAEPDIETGGVCCVEQGATRVIMLPYFLSAGIHVRQDLEQVRERLANRFPAVRFILGEPLGRHPLLIDIVAARAAEADTQS